MKKPWENGPLAPMKNGRYLQTGDVPFFWLGDTAWLLLHRLTREEIQTYLRNRAEKGFNVIQVSLVHWLPAENIYGRSAFLENDLAKPDTSGPDSYWDLLDFAFDEAAKLGLYLGVLPVWGSNLVKGESLTVENVTPYFTFLTGRYGKRPNLIWILGGDVRGDVHPEVWERAAELIRRETPQRLLCYHPFGRTDSSDWFGEAGWPDIHMFQSGHRRYDQQSLGSWDDLNQSQQWFGEDNWRYVERDLSLTPLRPTLDAEPSYEQIPQGLHDGSEPYWQDHDVRRYAYWSVFAGACGFTYGSNAVMQFLKPGFEPSFSAREFWDEALHHPGSSQVGFLRDLMEQLPFSTAHAAQHLLPDGSGERYDRIAVLAGEGFLLCYDYTGRPFRLMLQMPGFSTGDADAWWFDPSQGKKSYLGSFPLGKTHLFTPARRALGQNDVVLLLCPRQAK